MTLAEKYRPATFQQVIGQDKALAVIQRLAQGSLASRAFWFTGKSGTGKTTIARIMAGVVADQLYIREVVGRQLSPLKLKEIADRWLYIPMASKQGQVLIVNEAHGLSKPVVEILLGVIENLPKSVMIIFTTTHDGQDLFEEQVDSGPFASRCVNISLASRGIGDLFAARVKEIAQSEGLDGKPIAEYKKLMDKHRQNFRAALLDVEAGAML